MTTIIYNARVITDLQRFHGYVVIDGEFITEVGRGNLSAQMLDNAVAIDAAGALLLPGAIDTHVHFREPGLTRKATIATESAAAVAGGVTSFLDMPNTSPTTTSSLRIDEKAEIAAGTSYANYAFFIGATNDNLDEILAADYSRIPGVKLFMGSSTGNMLVDRREALDRLFASFPGVIAVHAEDEATIAQSRREIFEELGQDAPVTLHHRLRSREACIRSSSFAVELARKHNARLHLLHVSTADELDLLTTGDVTGKRITAETCPHYLLFSHDSLAQPRGFVRKCNPAIKEDTDRIALRKALAGNLIDTLATDHAPHLLAEKQGSLFKAASGMPGIKFLLPLMLDLTLDPANNITPEVIVEKLAHNPARLYNIDRRGFIRPGYYADLVIVKQNATPVEITDTLTTSHLLADAPEALTPPCNWTPYAGLTMHHQVLSTFVNGTLAFTDNHLVPSARNPHPLRFKSQLRD